MKEIIATDFYGNERKVSVGSLALSIHVYGIAVKDGKALVVPQFDGYDWPGGTLEMGETHQETLKREFKEETGLKIKPGKLLNAYTSFFHHPKYGKNYQSLLIFYAAEITGGEISSAGFDEDEKEYAELARWVEIDKLVDMRHACSIKIADDLIHYAKELFPSPNSA